MSLWIVIVPAPLGDVSCEGLPIGGEDVEVFCAVAVHWDEGGEALGVGGHW
ncbi:MAG: hypothetical protein ACI9EV_001535 [Urechidicola sp.]